MTSQLGTNMANLKSMPNRRSNVDEPDIMIALCRQKR